MSKGSPIIPIRFPQQLLAAVDAAVARLPSTSRAEPPDRSEFVRRACREKIDHYRRSARPRRRVPRRRGGVMHPVLSPGLCAALYAGGASCR